MHSVNLLHTFNRSVRRQAAAKPSYEFTSDWMTGNAYLFQRNLGHLVGTPCRILEIGSFEGRSTIWMLDHLATHPHATITCVDKVFRPLFVANMKKAGRNKQIVLHRGNSRDVLGRLEKAAFDFIYIDGDHSAVPVLEDAVLSFRLAKVGGIIAFDDYIWTEMPLPEDGFAQPAIDAFLDVYAARIDVIEKSHQVWLRKLRDDLSG